MKRKEKTMKRHPNFLLIIEYQTEFNGSFFRGKRFFQTYEAACRYALNKFNDEKHFWHFYKIKQCKDGTLKFEYFAGARGGQDHE